MSEGERNFIAFLYFYHLVKGSGAVDAAIFTSTGEATDVTDRRDKIVVIYDPVTSMDSGTLFIVSSMVIDGFNLVQEAVDPDQYRKVMKKIFEKLEQSQHYRMMTHEKD